MNNIQKDFKSWNSIKQLLDKKEGDVFYHEREVWWCSVGVNLGHESDGKHSHFERPVLIVKVFNRKVFWGIPLTSSIKINSFHISVWINDNLSSAMITQLRLFSSKRLLSKMTTIEMSEFVEVKKGIINFLT